MKEILPSFPRDGAWYGGIWYFICVELGTFNYFNRRSNLRTPPCLEFSFKSSLKFPYRENKGASRRPSKITVLPAF